MSDMNVGMQIARLTYLLTEYKINIPRTLVRYLPGGEWLSDLTLKGPGSVGMQMEGLATLIQRGSQLGEGSVAEVISIVQQLVDENITHLGNSIPLNTKLKLYTTLERFSATGEGDTEIFDLSIPSDIDPISKFDTGFEPFDLVSGGFYQGIIVLMGPPGSGKTSLMLTMMAVLRMLKQHEGSLLYVENEIPTNPMRGRMKPVTDRCEFISGDQLICGPWSAENILEYVKDHPDPNRVIFYDSPDVLSNRNGSEKRFLLEAQYETLIEIKKVARAVFVSSWPNRKQRVVTHMYDVAECLAKAWYADMMIGINPNPLLPTSLSLIVLKNRFGPITNNVSFSYQYDVLDWVRSSVKSEVDTWSRPSEEQIETTPKW